MSGVLIVGAGLAGLRVAETLRAEGYDRPVTVVGDEPELPYERPALSKEFLAGARSADDLRLRSVQELDERGIRVLPGSRVEQVGVRDAVVRGRRLRWDHLVLATGARPRRPGGPPLPGALPLRTLADARALRARLVAGTRVAVVGGGLVGAEVASTALGLGCGVAVVDPGPGPLAGAVGPTVSTLLAERWRRAGAAVHFGAAVAAVERRELRLTTGARVGFDVLVVAVGADPAGELLGRRGAVATDACGRTARARVYACGDVAAFAGRTSGHWTAAAGQAATVARTILGFLVPFADVPYFWSDQFGLRLQMVGRAGEAAAVALEGDEESFAARYVDRDGRLVAALLANRPADVGAARRELAAAA